MQESTTELLTRLGAGLAGAWVLNLVHESARHFIPHAPRVDRVGERLVQHASQALGKKPTPSRRYALAMGGDLMANSLYFAGFLGGRVHHPWLRGVSAGLLGGLGTTWLSPLLGLAKPPQKQRTRLMTVAWYTAGGLASAAAFTLLRRRT